MAVRSARLAAARQSSATAAWPDRGRLSIAALGLGLVLLVSVAWGTGLFYLLARLGAGSPVRLASLDGIHVYVGVVAGIFVSVKVVRVGLRHHVAGMRGVVPWHRWLSWSMLALYTAVFVTGVLLLLPVRGRLYAELVQIHTQTAVWALLVTTWHVWHYRAGALLHLRRLGRDLASRRIWIGLALILLPLPLLVADAPAVSQLSDVLGGARWVRVDALKGHYLDVIARAPDGTLMAAGDGLYRSRDGVFWQRVSMPAALATLTPSANTLPGSDSHGGPQAARPEPAPTAPPTLVSSSEVVIGMAHRAGHQPGPPAPPNRITAMAMGRSAVFVGTAQGLFTGVFGGPLEQVAFPGGGVSGLAMDPTGRQLWATSISGTLVSTDGGRTWAQRTAGLRQAGNASAIAYLGQDVFVSDGTGVFRWGAASGSWIRTLPMRSVVQLTPSPATGTLYASSESGELQVLASGRWTDLAQPATSHAHRGQPHGQPAAVTSVDGRLYAAGTPAGVSASADGGQTWTQLGGGLGRATPSQVVGYQYCLLAATSDGVYRFPLSAGGAATSGWWFMLLALAAGLGLAAIGVSALAPQGRRGWRFVTAAAGAASGLPGTTARRDGSGGEGGRTRWTG